MAQENKITFDLSKSVTKNLKFKPKEDSFCYGHLESVQLVERETKKVNDKGELSEWEYAGLTVPSLEFRFIQTKEKADEPDRVYTHFESVIAFTVKEGSKFNPQDAVLNMFYRLKHIHDAFSKSDTYQTIKSISPIDPNAAPAKRIEEFKKFFGQFADAFNKGKDDKPVYYYKSGKHVNLRMKLLPNYDTNPKLNATYLCFPNFVGEGFVEMCFDGVEPTLEIKRNEIVQLKDMSEVRPSTNIAGAASGDDLPGANILDIIKNSTK